VYVTVQVSPLDECGWLPFVWATNKRPLPALREPPVRVHVYVIAGRFALLLFVEVNPPTLSYIPW